MTLLQNPYFNVDIYPNKLPIGKFVNFEAIHEIDQNIKTIRGKLPGLSQQSTLAGNLEPIQFEIPQTKPPIQSSLVSQSPWLTLHGLALEQQDHTLSQSVN